MKKIYILLVIIFIGLDGNAQIVNIPDANFKARIISQVPTETGAEDANDNSIVVDINNDGEIQVEEAQLVYTLMFDLLGINSMVGIQSFTNLHTLYCSFNPFTTLDLSGMSNLTTLFCEHTSVTSLNLSGLTNIAVLELNYNPLTSIDLTGLNNLTALNCNNSQLTSLSINGNTSLHDIACDNNHLTSVSLTNLPNLTYVDFPNNQVTTFNYSNLPHIYSLGIGQNQLTTLDLSGLPSLVGIQCSSNPITAINVSGLTNLYSFQCRNSNLTQLDLTPLINLQELDCSYNNQLQYLFLKGLGELYLEMRYNPNLRYICASENQISFIEDYLSYNSINDVNVNSYCSFIPGSIYYTIEGNSRLDNDNNGCDLSDTFFPNLNFSVTNGSVTQSILADQYGGHAIPVQSGTYFITPNLENPTYFSVSPSSISVSFPTQASPFMQNFCVVPNGSHQDAETWIVPVTTARPGFDARYKIYFKNKGNITISGNLTFSFNDDYMDFISATPQETNQSYSLLSWNYANLLPYETREIEIKLNINTPMETLPVNIGDVIKFQSVITPLISDEYTTDNSNDLRQTVVGSFDPNDKICVEGDIVDPEMVGDYVHYVIRFENTGTAPAENVVVADIIDTNKFDMSSIVPLNGSHDFFTRISGSKVEFIFENINLPFDDANNDGYVVFKIRTKPTLVLGDTFSNTASIYFDYNFPIVTNSYTTTIAALGTQDFEFGTMFRLSPIPAKNNLTITTKEEITISSVSIYNTLGQLVQVITNPNDTIDVSGLKTGSYFIKIISDKGTSSSKFIKE